VREEATAVFISAIGVPGTRPPVTFNRSRKPLGSPPAIRLVRRDPSPRRHNDVYGHYSAGCTVCTPASRYLLQTLLVTSAPAATSPCLRDLDKTNVWALAPYRLYRGKMCWYAPRRSDELPTVWTRRWIPPQPRVTRLASQAANGSCFLNDGRQRRDGCNTTAAGKSPIVQPGPTAAAGQRFAGEVVDSRPHGRWPHDHRSARGSAPNRHSSLLCTV